MTVGIVPKRRSVHFESTMCALSALDKFCGQRDTWGTVDFDQRCASAVDLNTVDL